MTARDTAESYDRWFDAPWGRYAFAIEQRALTNAVGSVRGALVLDAGCGTGRFAEVLAAIGAHVVGLDINSAMLDVARERVATPFVRADAQRLPFEDAAFDVAVAITVLEFVPDPGRVIEELVRVSRAGGRIVAATLNSRSPWGLAHHERLRRPPWDRARFLSRGDLLSLATPFGDVILHGALHAPGALPGLRLFGPLLEGMGRVAPGLGAFQVVVIRKR